MPLTLDQIEERLLRIETRVFGESQPLPEHLAPVAEEAPVEEAPVDDTPKQEADPSDPSASGTGDPTENPGVTQ